MDEEIQKRINLIEAEIKDHEEYYKFKITEAEKKFTVDEIVEYFSRKTALVTKLLDLEYIKTALISMEFWT